MSKNVAFADSLHEKQMQFKPDQLQVAAGTRPAGELAKTAPRTKGIMDEQFPTAKLTEYEPKKDKEMVAKLELSQETGEVGYTPFGKLIAKDEDFKWYQRKQAAAEVANFERWFAQEFDLMDPAQKDRAKELYPEFYAARKKLLKQQTKNLFNLARIKLEGIQTFEDLKTTYLAESGRLDLGPLQNLLHPESAVDILNQERAQKAFTRGLASPFLVFGKQAYPNDTAARIQRNRDFAQREATAQVNTIGAGVDGVGFPPFKNGQGDQGDAAWYKVLGAGIAGMKN